MSLKASYDALKKRYSDLAVRMAGLIAKKEMMETSLAEVNKEIEKIVGNRNPEAVVAALSKEIETRLELLRSDIEKYEGQLREFNVGSSSSFGTLDDFLGVNR